MKATKGIFSDAQPLRTVGKGRSKKTYL